MKKKPSKNKRAKSEENFIYNGNGSSKAAHNTTKRSPKMMWPLSQLTVSNFELNSTLTESKLPSLSLSL